MNPKSMLKLSESFNSCVLKLLKDASGYKITPLYEINLCKGEMGLASTTIAPKV
jgi:hypothetical protein